MARARPEEERTRRGGQQGAASTGAEPPMGADLGKTLGELLVQQAAQPSPERIAGVGWGVAGVCVCVCSVAEVAALGRWASSSKRRL